jgi:DNA-binding MarR family transcriptional regulator
MDTLKEHCNNYKQALQNQDEAALHHEKAWLTTAATSALLQQDAQSMQRIKACCGELSALADHFDITGKPGDRWRALGDTLTLALESGKPLEQLRLVLPSTVSGLLMTHIQKEAGITPSQLAKRSSKAPNHVSNEIKKLENAGLIYRFKRGKNYELFLSNLGAEALADVAPMKMVIDNPILQKQKREYPHIDNNRIAQIGNPQLPYAMTA